MTAPSDSGRRELASLITDALHLADRLGFSGVAISLNDALVRLIGTGIVPPGF